MKQSFNTWRKIEYKPSFYNELTKLYGEGFTEKNEVKLLIEHLKIKNHETIIDRNKIT
jgi:hypothetical protein